MTNVHIESDSHNLVQAMHSTEFDRMPEGVIYRELRLYMPLHFNSFEFSFIPRSCNNSAHAFAAFGASQHE
jgi:hypothetical protein